VMPNAEPRTRLVTRRAPRWPMHTDRGRIAMYTAPVPTYTFFTSRSISSHRRPIR
jgi:hypothetical protein